MSAYRIQPGDTLSALSRRYGTTVDALMKANPQVKNANLIFAGATLNIPGAKDEFVAPKPAALGPVATGTSQAFDVARSYLGRNAGDLKRDQTPVGRAMEDWVPNDVNCANFVSGVLQAAGQIDASEHSNSVYGLMAKLDRDASFRRVSLESARPGDVVSFRTPGGQHVELFAGWQDGRALFIGSNNVNADGSQRVSYSQTLYPVMAVHHFVG